MLVPLVVEFLAHLALVVIAAVAILPLLLLILCFVALLVVAHARTASHREDEADLDDWPIR